MFKMIMKRRLEKNKKKGFTLIELIVVIVIIAIIAAIAVPALTRYIDSANNRAAQAQAHNIQVVLQAEVTTFYETNLSTAVTGGAGSPGTDLSPLFAATPAGATAPIGAPSDYPGLGTIRDILEYNGVMLIVGSTIENIDFDGKRLVSFNYVHDTSITVYYKDGRFDFNPIT